MMTLRNHISGTMLRLLVSLCLCIAILLPALFPTHRTGEGLGKKDPKLQAIHPIGLIDLFYTESSREELPEREVQVENELVLGVSQSRPAREPKRDRPLSNRAVQALSENHRHLHATLPVAEHALHHGNGLAAHCRC